MRATSHDDGVVNDEPTIYKVSHYFIFVGGGVNGAPSGGFCKTDHMVIVYVKRITFIT